MATMHKFLALHLLVGCCAMQARPQRLEHQVFKFSSGRTEDRALQRAQPRGRRRTEDPDVLTEQSLQAQKLAAERAKEALRALQRATNGTTPAPEALVVGDTAPASPSAAASEVFAQDEVQSIAPEPVALPWRMREATANPAAALPAHTDIGSSMGTAESQATEAVQEPSDATPSASSKALPANWMSERGTAVQEPSDAAPAASSEALPAPWMGERGTALANPMVPTYPDASSSSLGEAVTEVDDSQTPLAYPEEHEEELELETAKRLRAALDEAEANPTASAYPEVSSSSSVGEAGAEASEEHEETLDIAQRLRAELAGNQAANETASAYPEVSASSSVGKAEAEASEGAAPQSQQGHAKAELTDEDYQQAYLRTEVAEDEGAAPQSRPSDAQPELTEEDYQQAVAEHSMVEFIRRVIDAAGGEIKQEENSEKMLEMLARWHGGEKGTQTLRQLRTQLRKSAWISGFA